ncbi:UPF0057 membrane protein [Vanrija pseudolonga]|uniref:UPF0057 membrane protein n=1 Tax=Vanrija pseudolonga TaxID=143232 RepID=A0AAF0YGA6_9TREE|nr:UPF0057 membrane protein [Vanrija pseudolonga]
MADSTFRNFLLVIIALFIPPIPVYMKVGCTAHLLLNILLWFLGWIPGVIHAIYIIASRP